MRFHRSSVLGAVVALGSGMIVFTGGAAEAASYSVSVSAIGRTGEPVAIDAHLVNVRTGNEHDVSSRRAKRVPAGTYSVAASIWSADDTQTLGVRVVTVKRTTKVAFDARKGNRARFSVDDPTAETLGMQLVPFVKVGAEGYRQWAFNPLYGGLMPGLTYVIPAKSRYLSLFAYGHLEKKGSSPEKPSPYRFDVVHWATGGIPADVAFYDKRSKLAKVAVTVRSSAAGEHGALELSPANRVDGTLPATGTTEFGTLPGRVLSYRTPGVHWKTNVSSGGPAGSGGVSTQYDTRPPYKKGASTTEIYRAAAWSPNVSTGLDGRYLWIWPRPMLVAPAFGGSLSASDGRKVELYRGSRLVAKGTGGDMKVKLPTTSAWYTLKLTAERGSTDALSRKTWATWRFKARGYSDGSTHGGARVLVARLAPRGLDARNAVGRGSTTPVGLTFGYSLRSLVVEASFDGGATWKKVIAKRSGKGYVVNVANPRSAGTVSLRLKATESKGSSLAQTILNVYGVR